MDEEETPRKKLGELPEYIPPTDLDTFELTPEQRFRAAIMLRHNPFLVLLFVTIGSLLGYLGYVFFFQLPDITITDASARYSQNKSNGYQISLNFKIKNTGNGQTIDSRLYSAILDPRGFEKNKYSLAYSDTGLPDLKEEEVRSIPALKDVPGATFLQYLKTDRGLFLAVALRWKSNFWAFRKRTFESHLLLFLKQSVNQSFEIHYIHQSQWNWQIKDPGSAPNMNKLEKKINLDRPGFEL